MRSKCLVIDRFLLASLNQWLLVNVENLLLKIKTLKRYFWPSCTDQRPQNKLIGSMKEVESLRIQSFQGFWISWKIPGLDFWESWDLEFPCNLWLAAFAILAMFFYLGSQLLFFFQGRKMRCQTILMGGSRWMRESVFYIRISPKAVLMPWRISSDQDNQNWFSTLHT